MKTKTLRLPVELEDAEREVGSAEHIEESAAKRTLLALECERFLADQYRVGAITLRDLVTRTGESLSYHERFQEETGRDRPNPGLAD